MAKVNFHKRKLHHVKYDNSGTFRQIVVPQASKAFENMFKDFGELTNEQKRILHELTTSDDSEFMKLHKNYEAELKQLVSDYADVTDDIQYLTYGKFIGDLQSAINVDAGYYKSVSGKVHVFVQGIEIDGRCDLLRSGFNGEDYGVFARWTEVSETGIAIFNAPTASLLIRFNEFFTKDYLISSTEAEYNEAIDNMSAIAKQPYQNKIPLQRYVDYVNAHMDIEAKYYKKYQRQIKKSDIQQTFGHKEQLNKGE